jgi:hypothetical protein
MNTPCIPKIAMRRRARWLEESSGFDYTWRYRAGQNNVEDPISRAPQHFNSVLPMQLASIRDMVLICHAPMAIPGPLSGSSPDSLSGGCANPCDTSHSAADAHAPSTETASGPAALGDALGQVTTRTSRKRRAVSSKRGGDSPEMCEKGRLGGEADRERNCSLPAQGRSANCSGGDRKGFHRSSASGMSGILICLKNLSMMVPTGETRRGCTGRTKNNW